MLNIQKRAWWAPVICLALAPACAPDDAMYPITCGSSAYAQQRGVWLGSYRVTPSRIVVGDEFRLEIKEAFAHRRFMMNQRTGRQQLLDSILVDPQLVLVGGDGTRLGTAGFAWDMEITDPAVVDTTWGRTFSSNPGGHLIAFDLGSTPTYDPRPFSIILEVNPGKPNVRRFVLRCTPLPPARSPR